VTTPILRRLFAATGRRFHLVTPGARVLRTAAARSLCSPERLRGLRALAADVAQRNLTGDVAECGVYRGGSAAVLADQLLHRSPTTAMWLFDAFDGMPKPGAEDPAEAWTEVGRYASSEGAVRETFAAARVPFDRVHIVAGRFEETLPRFAPPPLVFLHVDCDWYASVKLCLSTLYDAVVTGGIVVIDDFGHWEGCRRAVEQFFAERGIQPTLIAIDYTSHYFVKS
jgi:O-methyltransferase